MSFYSKTADLASGGASWSSWSPLYSGSAKALATELNVSKPEGDTMATVDIDVHKFLVEVGDEVDRARIKFPSKENKTLAAAAEEFGEVAKALIEMELGKETPENYRKECVQLAAMAARLAIDGDASFPKSQR